MYVSFPLIQIKLVFFDELLVFPVENVSERHSDFRYSHQRLYLRTKLVLRHNWNVVTSFLCYLVTIEIKLNTWSL